MGGIGEFLTGLGIGEHVLGRRRFGKIGDSYGSPRNVCGEGSPEHW